MWTKQCIRMCLKFWTCYPSAIISMYVAILDFCTFNCTYTYLCVSILFSPRLPAIFHSSSRVFSPWQRVVGHVWWWRAPVGVARRPYSRPTPGPVGVREGTWWSYTLGNRLTARYNVHTKYIAGTVHWVPQSSSLWKCISFQPLWSAACCVILTCND